MLTYPCAKLAAVSFMVIIFICHSNCADEWQRQMSMDPEGKFKIFWNLSNENITIEVQVRTKGYVALGFSPQGGMKGADIVSGWVKDSQVFLQDRYATGNVEPIIDDNQDYELISGYENETHTVLQFTRLLSSSDQQDALIQDMVTYVIYAWGTNDPLSGTTIEYHGAQNRGTKAFNLISSNVDTFQITDDMKPFDFQMAKLHIPAEETTYWCQHFKVPETVVKIQAVQIQVILQPGNENLMHHILIHRCLDKFSAELDTLLDEPDLNCNNLQFDSRCPLFFMGFTMAKLNETSPSYVGVPFGEIDKPTYFVVNVHYHNPRLLSGIVDQTTIRFMTTEKLRKYIAGILTLASIPSTPFQMIIPPKQENFTVATILPSKCTKKMIQKDGINIMISFLHGHTALSKVYVRHFRNGVELPMIDYDNNYDFNLQHQVDLLKEVKILPGDSLAVYCVYNTMDRTNFTLGGLSTRDEMCIAFLYYYPIANLFQSVTFGAKKNIMNILESAERKFSKKVHNNISTGYEMTNDEYLKTFDATILTEQDISSMSYLQTYGRMQGMCSGHDGANELFDVEAINNQVV